MVNRLTLIARCLDRYGQRRGARNAITDLAIDIAIRRHYLAPRNYRDDIRIGKQLIDSLHNADGNNNDRLFT